MEYVLNIIIENYEETKRKSRFAQETLTKSILMPNNEKSTWETCRILT